MAAPEDVTAWRHTLTSQPDVTPDTMRLSNSRVITGPGQTGPTSRSDQPALQPGPTVKTARTDRKTCWHSNPTRSNRLSSPTLALLPDTRSLSAVPLWTNTSNTVSCLLNSLCLLPYKAGLYRISKGFCSILLARFLLFQWLRGYSSGVSICLGSWARLPSPNWLCH